MSFEAFSEIFAMLAIQLRSTDADEAMARAYYVTLKDLDVELVAMAAEALAKSGEWFPKTSEWREAVHQVEHRRKEHQRALMRKSLTAWCQACSDTGWEHLEAGGVRPCSCASLRRMEILGRRPWPLLTSGGAA